MPTFKVEPSDAIEQPKFSSLNIFKMKQKLGIKQDLSASEIQSFKQADINFDAKNIQETPSPNERLYMTRLLQMR